MYPGGGTPPGPPTASQGPSPPSPSVMQGVTEEWDKLGTPGKVIAIAGVLGAILAAWILARRSNVFSASTGGFPSQVNGVGGLPATQQSGGGGGIPGVTSGPAAVPPTAPTVVSAPVVSAPRRWPRSA